MQGKIYFLIILISVVFLIPVFSFADRGMIVWPPKVHLDQSAQNAICAWNGEEEIIILSTDIKSSEPATVLEILPLPSNPSEIKEGNFESFEKLVEIINKKIETIRNQWMATGKGLEEAPTPGVEITFHEKIGAHDVTVVKVNDLDYFLNWIKDFTQNKGLEVKEISQGFREGVNNYLKRDIKYFVFDVINTKEEEESIKPLIYKFKIDYLYYPLSISGISEIGESRADIHVFLITESIQDDRGIAFFGTNYGPSNYPVAQLTREELNKVSEELVGLFTYGSVLEVRKFDYYGYLKELKSDAMFYSQIWKRNLGIGSIGGDVKALEKILINEGYLKIRATNYFGPKTLAAVRAFQEKYRDEISKFAGYQIKCTGFVGKGTRAKLNEIFGIK